MTEDQKRYQKRKPYLIKKVTEARMAQRRRVVELLGGCCIICGYKRCFDSLCAHHIDPKEKEFGLSYKGMYRSWTKVLVEVKKCVLLCANCHNEVHHGMTVIPEELIAKSKELVEVNDAR